MTVHGGQLNSPKFVLHVLFPCLGCNEEERRLAVEKIRKPGSRWEDALLRWEDALLCALRPIDSSPTKMVLI